MASVSIHSFTAARAVVGKRHALPLGLFARFSATLQDDLGRVMDSSSTRFVYRLTRWVVIDTCWAGFQQTLCSIMPPCLSFLGYQAVN